MDAGQTPMTGRQTFKSFFSSGHSPYHNSGTLSAAVSDSAFRYPDMHVSFPPLSASSAAPAPAVPGYCGEIRSHAGHRALGTSRLTGSASWGTSRAPVKRRGSLSSLGDVISGGQQQRQTLKLADITDFDLTRPSAFEKLSDLYRNKSTLDGPSAHAILGREARQKHGPGPSKQKSKPGPLSHHVHLPQISMDSSPPLVSFRHSRIKPSTLTENETGLPSKAHQPAQRTQSSNPSADEGKLNPRPLPIRKNESSRAKNNSVHLVDKTQNSTGSERGKQLQVSISLLPSVSTSTIATALTSPSAKTHDSASRSVNREVDSSESEIILKNPLPGKLQDGMDPSVRQSSAQQDAINSSMHLPLSGTQQTLTATGPASRGALHVHPKVDVRAGVGLSLSEYTAIIINNDGCEGETLSTVRSDTFLGERRSVRFSVSTKVIEYEPGASLAGDDRQSVDQDNGTCMAITE